MTKLTKLTNQFTQISNRINAVSIERRDTSAKSGKFFKTMAANTDGLIVIETVQRTMYLNTYICVSPEHTELVNQYRAALAALKEEQDRLHRIAERKRVKEAPAKAVEYVDQMIEDGTHLTNYGKVLLVGNANIYACHPFYGHSDYNKHIMMPNSPANRRLANQLNDKLRAAGMNF